jgi:hypothetical protein
MDIGHVRLSSVLSLMESGLPSLEAEQATFDGEQRNAEMTPDIMHHGRDRMGNGLKDNHTRAERFRAPQCWS